MTFSAAAELARYGSHVAFLLLEPVLHIVVLRVEDAIVGPHLCHDVGRDVHQTDEKEIQRMMEGATKLIVELRAREQALLHDPLRIKSHRFEQSQHVADRMNLAYNLVPSLHVAMSIVCIETFARHASTTGKIALRSWGLVIAASTLLTHQHHMLDVVTGHCLAMAVAARRDWVPS